MSDAQIHDTAGGAAAQDRTGARLVVDTLDELGVEYIFGYPGGAIMPVYDALVGAKLKHILMRHEQGAAFAADAYARVSGRAGVCMATSGPGATNLITGLANAFLDSVPLIAITGQVPTGLMGTDAFQEVDIFGATLPVVKHSFLIREHDDIPLVLEEALEIATTGRPGPVLVDIPKNIMQSKSTSPNYFERRPTRERAFADDKVELANALIRGAQKPILYIGGGVALGEAVPELRAFAERSGIPAVSTLKGLGTLPTDETQLLGMLGMHGSKAANVAVQESDLLICAGARFDDRATGHLDSFAPHAKVIHLDADAAEISKLRDASVGLAGDIATALDLLTDKPANCDAWRDYTQDLKAEHAFQYDAPGEGVYAPALLKKLSEAAGDDFIAACDVGQHQMWVAQHCRFSRPQAHLTSGGLGAMGYGLPAGIGAKFAEPDAQVVTVSGDGSIMMNIQELATLKRYNIPLKVLLLDNSALGLVRQWQELFYEENFSEIDLSDNPDFAKVGEAFGIDSFTVTRRDEVDGAIDRLLSADTATLAHVRIDPKENVWPLVPPGKSNADMMEG